MKRKDFLRNSLLASMGISFISEVHGLNSSERSGELSGAITTAGDLNAFLRSLTEVAEPSVDRIVIGDPSTKIRKIGTCWMPYWDTLKQAFNLGINVMVVHEPTFYTHWDLDNPVHEFYRAPKDGRDEYTQLVERKKKWISEKGLVIIRCHDVWDKIAEIGIPFALGKALGFSLKDIRSQETYYNVYQTEPRKAIDVAHDIARKLKTYGQPGVAFYGDENFPVSSIGIGTGCICDPLNFYHLKPDMFLAITDIVSTWIQTSYARDCGKPLVVIDHGTSEEPGVRMLSDFLTEKLPGTETIHFHQGCTYKWIS